jgi:hypothetical protein
MGNRQAHAQCSGNEAAHNTPAQSKHHSIPSAIAERGEILDFYFTFEAFGVSPG